MKVAVLGNQYQASNLQRYDNINHQTQNPVPLANSGYDRDQMITSF